jgi:hypothetical protein
MDDFFVCKQTKEWMIFLFAKKGMDDDLFKKSQMLSRC